MDWMEAIGYPNGVLLEELPAYAVQAWVVIKISGAYEVPMKSGLILWFSLGTIEGQKARGWPLPGAAKASGTA